MKDPGSINHLGASVFEQRITGDRIIERAFCIFFGQMDFAILSCFR
jgi:hypothetical protein